MKQLNRIRFLSLIIASTLIGAAGVVSAMPPGAMFSAPKQAVVGWGMGAGPDWGAVKMSRYQARQTRSRAEDKAHYISTDPEFYGLAKTATQSVVKIRDVVSGPEKVKPGDMVTNSMTYSVTTPKETDRVGVTETYRVMKDGKLLTEIPQSQTRQAGSWKAEADIPIPAHAKPGTYVVEHEISVGTTKDVQRSFFIVG